MKKIFLLLLIVTAGVSAFSIAAQAIGGDIDPGGFLEPGSEGETWLMPLGIESRPGARDGHIIPVDCTDSKPDTETMCDLDDAFQTIINFSKLIVALAGSAALLMFVWGGVLWILSAGNAERVEKGKQAMQAAAIGIIIILGAWLVVNFVILALTGGAIGGPARIFQGQTGEQLFGEQPKVSQ